MFFHPLTIRKLEFAIFALHRITQKKAGHAGEAFGRLGGEETAVSALGEPLLHLGVAAEVVMEAAGDVLSLCEDVDAGGQVLSDEGQQEGVVGTAEDEGIDAGVGGEEAVQVPADEESGAFAGSLVVLNERYPEGTGFGGDGEAVAVHLGDLYLVGVRGNGTFGGKEADVAGVRYLADGFDGGADNAEDSPVGGQYGEVALLDGTQSLGGGGVTGEDDKRATLVEEADDGLAGETVNGFERTSAIGSACIVAEIDIVVTGQTPADTVEDGQSSVSGIENTNSPHAHGGTALSA
jgi:hypothetical protein